jgi:hypothetical protein
MAISSSDLIADMDCEACREEGRHLKTDPMPHGGGCLQEGVKLSKPWPYFTKGTPFYQKLWHCPRSCHIAVSWAFELYKEYKDGHLPGPGGTGAQPAKAMQAIRLCSREVGALEAESIRDQKRDLDRRKAQNKGR